MFYLADPKLRIAPRAPGERVLREKTPRQRLESIVSGLLFAVSESQQGLSKEETITLLGSALRRTRGAIAEDAICGLS